MDFVFLLNLLVVYSLPTAMSSFTGKHKMDLLYLLKQNLKNLLFGLLITRRSVENLPHLSSCSLSERRRFWRILIESDLAYTEVSGVAFYYILWSGSIWYPVRSSMLRNKLIFSLVISKLMLAFSTVQIDVAKYHIN